MSPALASGILNFACESGANQTKWNLEKLAKPDKFSPEGTNENSPQFQLRD
jgi:hypothetical protein